MKLHNITPAEGSVKKGKRIGRGQGSGAAGTAGRGHKGAKSRSGYSRKIGFEGGQMPLQRRVPKFGFTNPNRVEYKGVNLDTLQKLADDKKVKEITPAILNENGLVAKKDLVKILGRGELKAKLTVTVHGYSASAKAAIEAAGGKADVIGGNAKAEKAAPKKEAKAAAKAKDASTEEE
jgi:large subunit ribosomal protein L15